MFNKRKKLILFLLIFLLALTGCSSQGSNLTKKDIISLDKNIEVHFIDVGQGDSIYIKQADKHMLVDGGDVQYGDTVVAYLKNQGVSKLDYIIGTHPHADHIGGLDKVIKTFDVGKIIFPEVTHTTKAFEIMLLAIQDKGLKITLPKAGDLYDLGASNFTILAPNKDSYSNLNDYSVGIRLEHGKNSFVLTGDAEVESENEMVSNGLNIKADVLKLGHHGSDTSTNQAFLDKVDPKYAVITLGLDNSYGHPHESVLKRLEEKNIEIYRTDLHGTIIATGDGETISFKAKKNPETTNSSELEEQYIGNKNSQIFHRPTCSSLPNEENRVYFENKEEALSAGHRGCKRCNP